MEKDIILLKFEDNWADEMDVEGCEVITLERLKYFNERVEAYFLENDSLEYYIGTNECIEYTSAGELLSKYSVLTITETDYQTLNKLGLLKFGIIGPFEIDYWDDFNDEE